MIQGCSSDAGKSYLVAGLCRLFAGRGLRVAPFKGQNMSNNAGVVSAGLEMGRAQLLQARAARIAPDVRMNPVLVKPEGRASSQVVVLGEPDLELSRLPWNERVERLWPHVRSSLYSLMEEVDLVLIEGAGSPAEVNLRAGDVVNMRVAREVASPVLLAADIDRGGAFAHLLGTYHALVPEERKLLAGFILNRFRGEQALLGSAPAWLESRTGVPVVGVVPHLPLPLPDEDSFSLERRPRRVSSGGAGVRIAVVRLPAMSNFDEFDPLRHHPGVELIWIDRPQQLEGVEAVLLPGSKAVLGDLAWLRSSGLATAVSSFASGGGMVMGICGGFQMLGRRIADPHGIEGGGEAEGIGLLDVETELALAKTIRRTETRLARSRERVSGYEIHHGRTSIGPAAESYLGNDLGVRQGRVVGVYLHGLFEDVAFRRNFLSDFGVEDPFGAWGDEVERGLDTLAAHLDANLDLKAIEGIIERGGSIPRGRIFLFTGGTRSGKSRHALSLSRHLGGPDVTFIATLEATDSEMHRRITRHQTERPPTWRRVEPPVDPLAALRDAATSVVLLDCLSGLIASKLLQAQAGDDDALVIDDEGLENEVLASVEALVETVRRRRLDLVIVSNEVGSGVVPATALGRRFRDLLGVANQRVAARADAAALVVAGVRLTLKGSFPDAV